MSRRRGDRTRGRDAGRGSPSGRWLVPALVLSGVLGCTFERRTEPEPEDARAEEEATQPVPEGAGTEIGAAPLETVELFRESVAAGDLSLALALLDREATLVDELVGEASEARTRGELVLELRRQHAAGLVFDPLGPPATIASGESALVVSRFTMLRETEGGAREELGLVHETVFLLALPDGWRIRHLHRSLASDG